MQHPHLMSDKDLVRLYLKGNDNAFAILLKRHKDKIFATIYHLVRHQELAEDLFQDALMKIITKLKEKKYDEEGKFLPWAVRVAHNLVIDYFRTAKNKTRMVRETEEFNPFNILPEKSRNAAEEMIRNENIAEVRALIERLPDHLREIVILRHYAQLSFKEIATLLDMNINTALGWMHTALLEMRKMMAESQELK